MRFHEKLYELRKSAGMTQNDLAEKLNVSRQAVSRWEMGTAMPDVENLIAISDLFGVTLDELLRDGAAPKTQMQEKPEPRYWDYVNEKWWLPLVLSGVAYLCIYFSTFLYALFPRFSGSVNEAASGNWLLTVFGWIFGPMGFSILARLLPLKTVCDLGWGLIEWNNAKKKAKE